MKCVFQIIKSEDGRRSPPACMEREEFANLLRNDGPHRAVLDDKDFVLVIMERLADDQEWQVSACPLVSVGRFISEFASREVA